MAESRELETSLEPSALMLTLTTPKLWSVNLCLENVNNKKKKKIYKLNDRSVVRSEFLR